MSITALYREQHTDLVKVVQDLAANLDEKGLVNGGSKDAKELLDKLARRLLVHLSAEDHGLYPKMIASSDEEVSTTAKKFQDEMGSLKTAFQEYYEKWNMEQKIQADPAGFIKQTQGVLEALGARVKQEDTVLYPLADRLG